MGLKSQDLSSIQISYIFTIFDNKLVASMRCIYFIILFLSKTFVFCQSDISFRQLSVIQGLSQNSAISITQDRDGFLWIATQDGLNRYDGATFKKYPFQFEDVTKPTFSYLGKVVASELGDLWVIPSNRSLHRYQIEKDTFLNIRSQLSFSTVLPQQDQGLWIGTHGQGVWYEDFRKRTRKQIKLNALKNTTIFGLHSGRNNDCLVSGTGVAGVLNASSNNFFVFKNINKNINYSSMVEDSHGDYWVGSYGFGLWRVSKGDDFLTQVGSIHNSLLPKDLNIETVYCDRYNRIWVATYGSGLYMIDDNRQQIHHFTHEKQNPRTLHYNDLLSIYEDYSGTLWFGTDGGGMSYYDQFLEKFTPYLHSQLPDDVNIDVVRSITKDKQFLWIGTSGKGLTRYSLSDGSWKTFTTENLSGLTSNRIMSLYHFKNELWIGSQEGGLHILDKSGQCRTVHSTHPKVPHTIWTLYKDSQGRMWMGTRDQGLVRVNENGQPIQTYDFKSLTQSDSPVSVRAIEEGGGYFWLATDFYGLIRWHPETQEALHFLPKNTQKSISNRQIKTLYFQKDLNLLWIGTNGSGLDVLDLSTQVFYNYSEKEGLANGVIYAVLEDDAGSLWLSSNKGITRFEVPKDLQHNPKITNFSNYDGLATEFNTGAYFKSEDGTLYFGSLEGFYAFKPSQIITNTLPPKTKITSFEVFNREVSIQNSLRLKHHQNTLTFHFAGLQFSLPQKNVYRYRLLPLENEWIEAGNINFARYTNLSAGSYEFQVSSGNYDGYWGENYDQLDFKIDKAWYVSNLMIVLYLLTFLLLLYAIIRYYQTQLDFKKKRAEAEQLQQLNQYKSKLFAELSHEIRTPLTLIKLPLDKQLQNENLEFDVKRDLEIVSANNQQLIELVDQLQDLTQVETGSQKLQIREGSLAVLIQTISDAFHYQTIEKQQIFNSEIHLNELCWYDEQIVLKVLNNLLSNAIKYTPKGGNIRFSVKTIADGYLQIRVSNDLENVIISPHRLFERFYRESNSPDGSGIGLALVKELVELHQGKIELDDKKKSQLSLVFTLPVAKKHYSDDVVIDKASIEPSSVLRNEIYETILIIEDHPELRTSLAQLFEDSFRVLTASNGFEGIKIIKKELPDLVISDVMMPLMDGFQVCHEVKTSEITSHIPVVLLTAKSDSEAIMKGMKEGADAYIKKPFQTPFLKQQVINILQTKRSLRDTYQTTTQLEKMALGVNDAAIRVKEKLQQVIEKKILEADFDTDTFSQFMGMSRMQLHRKIKTITGQTPHDFVKFHRLKYADHLLLYTELQIAEIAFQSGFGSSSHFSKTYKSVYGITPNEKRASHRK